MSSQPLPTHTSHTTLHPLGKLFVLCSILIMSISSPAYANSSPPTCMRDVCRPPSYNDPVTGYCTPNNTPCSSPNANCIATGIESSQQHDAQGGAVGFGVDLVTGIFTAINSVLSGTTQAIYTSITQNTAYQNAVNAVVIVYISVYGILLMFGLVSARASEVASRLIKVGVLWSIISPSGGWTFFNQWIASPTIGAMNELITLFSTVGNAQANGSGLSGSANLDQLDPTVMTTLTGPITLLFSATLASSVAATFSTGSFGSLFALLILWGLFEFFLMLVGALTTYIKSIVGLAFLFALGPIFFAFTLFEKTRQIFMGWAGLVLGFFLQPVLLFAFLGFYGALLLDILNQIIYPNNVGNYCWVQFAQIGPLNLYWWRVINSANGVATCQSGNSSDCYAGDWTGPPPVDIMTILYFLLLTHLGKQVGTFLEQLAEDISGASGAGIVRHDMVSRWLSNTFTGGRGVGGIARDFSLAAAARIRGGILKIKNRTVSRAAPRAGSAMPSATAPESARAEMLAGLPGARAPGPRFQPGTTPTPQKNPAAPTLLQRRASGTQRLDTSAPAAPLTSEGLIASLAAIVRAHERDPSDPRPIQDAKRMLTALAKDTVPRAHLLYARIMQGDPAAAAAFLREHIVQVDPQAPPLSPSNKVLAAAIALVQSKGNPDDHSNQS